jgi:hypothetical protein
MWGCFVGLRVPSCFLPCLKVDAAVSFKVVNCFLGIVVFQLVCEHVLEVVEEAAHGEHGTQRSKASLRLRY